MNRVLRKKVAALLGTHASKGFLNAVRSARDEWQVSRWHRAALKKCGPFLAYPEKKLNLGSGPNPKKGWINIDLYHEDSELRLDLRERWPFADGTVTQIYSEHVFEHFEILEEVPHILAESLRVLKSGGLFEVGVPDTEWPILAYPNNNDPYWPFSETVHPRQCRTKMDHINFHFRQGTQHKYAWDYETLAAVLATAGFVHTARRDFDPAMDSLSRKTGTLYVKAYKLFR